VHLWHEQWKPKAGRHLSQVPFFDVNMNQMNMYMP
jgi:hypothetical protein